MSFPIGNMECGTGDVVKAGLTEPCFPRDHGHCLKPLLSHWEQRDLLSHLERPPQPTRVVTLEQEEGSKKAKDERQLRNLRACLIQLFSSLQVLKTFWCFLPVLHRNGYVYYFYALSHGPVNKCISTQKECHETILTFLKSLVVRASIVSMFLVVSMLFPVLLVLTMTGNRQAPTGWRNTEAAHTLILQRRRQRRNGRKVTAPGSHYIWLDLLNSSYLRGTALGIRSILESKTGVVSRTLWERGH